MIVDIFNEVYTELKNEIPNANVLNDYPFKVSKFPTIVIEELDNTVDGNTVDSSGFNHTNISFRIEIFTKGNRKLSDSKKLRKSIDDIMSGKYGMERIGNNRIKNFIQDEIERLQLTYVGKLDKNKRMYRR